MCRLHINNPVNLLKQIIKSLDNSNQYDKIGGKKGFKRGYICVRTFGNKIFSIERLSKNIKEILLIKGQRVKDVLITDWKEVNQIDYKQLTDDENETPCKLL